MTGAIHFEEIVEKVLNNQFREMSALDTGNPVHTALPPTLPDTLA